MRIAAARTKASKALFATISSGAGCNEAGAGCGVGPGEAEMVAPGLWVSVLNEEHAPESPGEASRVRACGGGLRRTADGLLRVDGSRAFLSILVQLLGAKGQRQGCDGEQRNAVMAGLHGLHGFVGRAVWRRQPPDRSRRYGARIAEAGPAKLVPGSSDRAGYSGRRSGWVLFVAALRAYHSGRR